MTHAHAEDEGLIDLHAHFLPGWYVEEAVRGGHVTPDGMPRWPEWDVESHLALMDRTGVRRSILSISSPGVRFSDPELRRSCAKRLNDDAAAVCGVHPARFGFLATLPLPDLAASARELRRAVGELGAAGVILPTNVDGVSIADPSFTALWKDLSALGCVVLLHPTSPVHPVAAPFPAPMMEFLFDTARAVAGLAFADRLRQDAPDVRVVVPHVGGVIPVLVERWEAFAAMSPGLLSPDRIARTLDRLWFDLAGTPEPVQADLLVARWGEGRIVYGSDFCFTPAPLIEAQVRALDEKGIAGVDDWRATAERNAVALLG